MRRPSEDSAHRAVESTLTDPSLAPLVDMVLSTAGPHRYRAASAGGTVTFERSVATGDSADDGVERYRYEVVDTTGEDPLANRSTARFGTVAEEMATPHPGPDVNSFPHAYDQIAQFFDAPHAPDLMVQHTPGHHFGGAVGQHGSLGIVQARAPFVLAGAGVAATGRPDRSARMIDVAPTFLRLLGGAIHPSGVGPTGRPRRDALLARQDGDALDDLVEEGGAEHLVVILLDGCNANVLYDAVDTGAAPNIAALAAGGTTLGRGLMASFPTATLANHTTASTGAHPGHSGVLHNCWYDRDTGASPDLLAMDQVFDAMRHLAPGIETVHEALHRDDPHSFTASLYELCDRGADFSSFAAIRDGRLPDLPQAHELRPETRDFVDGSGSYSFTSSVDEHATRQAVRLWERSDGNPLPRFTFLSLSLTDEAGHECGPYSEMAAAAISDGDHRVGRLVDAVRSAGAFGRTAFAVIADHGMELSDVANAGAWSDHLAAHSGVRDVADGLIYVATA